MIKTLSLFVLLKQNVGGFQQHFIVLMQTLCLFLLKINDALIEFLIASPTIFEVQILEFTAESNVKYIILLCIALLLYLNNKYILVVNALVVKL